MPAKAGISRYNRYALQMAHGGWVYIMTNRPRGMLYTGVTAELAPRVQAHKDDRGSAFCRRYGLHMLAYAEQHNEIVDAIAREKAIKAWKRAWKIELIESINSEWRDLYDDLT